MNGGLGLGLKLGMSGGNGVEVPTPFDPYTQIFYDEFDGIAGAFDETRVPDVGSYVAVANAEIDGSSNGLATTAGAMTLTLPATTSGISFAADFKMVGTVTSTFVFWLYIRIDSAESSNNIRVRVNTTDGLLQIIRDDLGVTSVLDSQSFIPVSGTEYTLRVVDDGTNIYALIDDVPKVSVVDAVAWDSTVIAIARKTDISNYAQYGNLRVGLPLVSGFAITGQSLALGGIGGDVDSGIRPPVYPHQALTLFDGPMDDGITTPGDYLVSLNEEPNRHTIGTSLLRGFIFDTGVGDDSAAVFHGSARGGQNYDELKKGAIGGVYEEVITQANNAKIEQPALKYKHIIVIHGEQDGLDNNATYDADLLQWKTNFNTDLKAVTGQTETINMLLCQTATAGGYGRNGGITELTFPSPLLQLQAHIDNSDIFMVCSKYHLPYADHAHITNRGQRILGEYYNKARAAIESGGTYEPVRPTSIAGVGSTVVVDFTGNVGNLVFDTTLVNAATDQGFAYVDDSGRAITGVAITGAAQVTITLDGTVGTNPVLAYAYHNGAGGSVNQVAGDGDRGNLRDSNTDVSLYNSDVLYNWCVIFREAVT